MSKGVERADHFRVIALDVLGTGVPGDRQLARSRSRANREPWSAQWLPNDFFLWHGKCTAVGTVPYELKRSCSKCRRAKHDEERSTRFQTLLQIRHAGLLEINFVGDWSQR